MTEQSPILLILKEISCSEFFTKEEKLELCNYALNSEEEHEKIYETLKNKLLLKTKSSLLQNQSSN